MFVECAIEDEVVVIKHKFKQIHDVINRLIGSFRDGRIRFKSVLSHLVCQCCGDGCKKRHNIKGDHDLLSVDGASGDLSHKVIAVRNSVLVM